LQQWEAHERRIWVVDSCAQQPDQFATGSDDGTVKAVAKVDALLHWHCCCTLCEQLTK
jgi:hypothetical protein